MVHSMQVLLTDSALTSLLGLKVVSAYIECMKVESILNFAFANNNNNDDRFL